MTSITTRDSRVSNSEIINMHRTKAIKTQQRPVHKKSLKHKNLHSFEQTMTILY